MDGDGRPEMTDDEATVTAADIARIAGVGRAAVSNWRRRYADFPEPVGGTASSPTFSLKEIEEWLRLQGKVQALPLRERAWQQIRAATDDLRLGEAVAEAAELLCGKGTPRLVPQQAVELLKEYREQSGEEAVRFLLDRYAEVHSRRLAETPPEVAEFMARLAGPGVRTVLDPACGLGILLSAMKGVEHAYGQEIEEALARIAKIRLDLTGIPGEVRAGDSLRDDAWPDLLVDAVVCHPPFNERNWGYDELVHSPRWEYGLPPKTESELAWVQHALSHLVPGGLALLLLPAVVAARRSGRRIRSNLLRRGALQAVIGLSAKTVGGTGLPVHIWILRKPADDGPPPSRVLMAEAEPGTFDEVIEVWREFQADREREIDRPGLCRTVPVIELVDDAVDVTPGRYVGAQEVSASDFPAIRERLLRGLKRTIELIPEAVPGGGRTMPLVTVSELERIGALEMVQAGRFEIDGTGQPVITDQDLLSGSRPRGQTSPEGRIRLRPGDVVVAVRGGELAARVIRESGLLLGPRLTLLRPDPAHLDADFLAGFLQATAAVAGTPSGIGRFDPRRSQVPRLPLEEQRRYGEAFRRIAEFGDQLRESAQAAHRALVSIALGFVTGTLTPPPGRGSA
ncbi:SAM-dependent methyltransferase [Thermobispora bispora]